jgi:two-component system chemotaxis response regulator CheB
MTARTRVLVVDDSPTMRSLIRAVLRSDPAIEVVGEAADALEARSAIKQLNPDVITLDVEMPNMNGIEFLDKIMKLRPMPVIMVSTLTQRGAEATLAALEIGAFDCIGKPLPGDPQPFAGLAETVKAAARSQRHLPEPMVGGQPAAAAQAYSAPSDYQPARKIIAIGASTGGVEALIAVLTKFPANCPPTVITQHMPATFTKSFAERLNRLCAPQVKEAEDGDRLEIGRIYLAPGGDRHMEISNPTGAALHAGRRRTRERAPAFRRCHVPVGRPARRAQGGRNHPYGNGARWCGRTARNAQGWRHHHRPERKNLCRLRHAARRARNRCRRFPVAS